MTFSCARFRPLICLIALATFSEALHVRPASADSSPRLAQSDGEECGEGETPEYFAARYQWYLERYGVNGVFDPELRLRQVREAYGEYRRELATGRRSAASPAGAAAPITAGAFRFVGPVNGAGRATAIEPHPTDSNIVYVGAAGGGCWKSIDGGVSWRPLTDGLADLSVGAIAVAPSNPSIVYLGTGEGGYGGNFVPGIGLFRSTDAGETWLLPAGVVAPLIYRLSVDPRNASILLAFTNNGAQRSTDGGLSFVRTSDASWGDGTDVARDATNADVLHATFWAPGGAESARYAKSTNGGVSWTEKGTGLPPNPKGRMSIAVSGDGASVVSMISGSGASGYPQVGVYQSTNGGESWSRKLGDTPNILSGQGWYDNAVAIDPDDRNVVLLGGGGAGLYRSTDGGATVKASGAGVHVDHHQLVYKKYGATKLLWNANDGGVWVSPDSGLNWLDRNAGLGTRQYYSVAIDPARPNVLYAGAQDNGSNRRLDDDTNRFSDVSGGDGFETVVDPDSGIVFTSSQFSTIWRNTRDGSPNNSWAVSQPFAGAAFSRTGGDAVKPFYSVITLDPRDPRTVYTGTYRLWRSDDSGESWNDLSAAAFRPTVPVYAIAVSRSDTDRLLVAQSNRLLVSSDRGASFTSLSTGTNGLPVTGIVFKNVEIDPRNADVFYVSVNAGSAGQVYKSTNAGGFFSRADTGLPAFGLEVVRVDPGDSQTLYGGTLVGLYRSVNGGATWARWGDGLPAVAVHEVRATLDGSRIVVATHGRGVWAAEGVNANRAPVAAILSPAGAVTIGAGQSVIFSGSASDPDGSAIALRWSFGDGMSGTGAEPGKIVYRTPGVFRVSFVAEDDKGGRGGASTTVTVRALNDDCANAQPLALVSGVTVVTRTGNAGTLVTDPADPATCSQPAISNSVWFTFTPPATGTLELDTFGSLGDTVLALYDGPCGAAGPALACNDDADGVSGGPSQLATQNVTSGKTYRVLAATWSSPSDGFSESVDSLRVRARFTPAAAVAPTPGTTAILPVVLDATGRNGAHFSSDLVALNRGSSPLTVAFTYGGPVGGTLESTSSLVLPAGAQLRAADALAELRREGISIPRTTPTSSQVGSLTALVTGGDPNGLVLLSRTSSPNTNAAVGGTFGLFSAGTPFALAADGEAVFVYGLRQTERDRANLALVHVRTPRPASEAATPITLAIQIFDASGGASPTPLANVVLQPGEWKQLNEVLSLAGLAEAGASGGVARIRRIAGTGRFVAYGVVNDQKTADGSFIPMTRAGELKASDTLLVPIVLEAGGLSGSFFTSELVLANRSASAGAATVRYVASPLFGGLGSGSATFELGAGSQLVVPSTIQALRQRGLAIPTGSAQGGALFVTWSGFAGGDDVYAGVRTGTPNPDSAQGGSFGVFSPALGTADLAGPAAIMAALRQDDRVRSNLAVVNGGGEPITLAVAIRTNEGASAGSVLSRVLAPGEWYQWSNVFALAGYTGDEGYAVVTRTAGTSPWYAYGVLNDAATSDGSVITPVR
ncbi:MAG: PKD domain-containing protein [Thermoanaerobaculia bacterium]